MSVVTWEAARLALGAAVLLAGSFWVSYTSMEALFGGQPVPAASPPAPSPAPAPPKVHPSPTPHQPARMVPHSSTGPVTAIPIPARSRQPATTPASSPAFTTPTATLSPAPTPTYSPTPSVPPTATTAPSAATPALTPPLPGDGSGP